MSAEGFGRLTLLSKPISVVPAKKLHEDLQVRKVWVDNDETLGSMK